MGKPDLRFIHLTLAFFILFFISAFPTQGAEKKKVYVIPVSGTVDPGMAAYIERTMTAYGKDPSALIVLEMDTFGGRVDSALEIVDHISNIPKSKVISYVTKRAISAGALIALSANELVMQPNTLIGDCAPIISSSEGPKMLGEKIQSPLRAKFRALAKKNGYPSLLAESMVSIDMEVYEIAYPEGNQYIDGVSYNDLSQSEKDRILSKKTVVAKGELLTMDNVEAQELGFSKATVNSLEEMLDDLGYQNTDIIRIKQSWSEYFVRYIGSFTQILMLIGLGMLYLEYKSPGFGIFGIIGITCLGLVFFNQYLVGMADYTELLILLIGIALLGLEIFVIPGFGIAGFSGLTIIGIGLILMMQGFVLPDPSLPWQVSLLIRNTTQVLINFVLVFIGVLFILRYVFPKLSRSANGPYLSGNLSQSHISQARDKGVKVGDTGIADTQLRPSGKITIGEHLLDAISEGEFIKRGSAIEIIRIDGNRIIVTAKERNG